MTRRFARRPRTNIIDRVGGESGIGAGISEGVEPAFLGGNQPRSKSSYALLRTAEG